ncbi:MAG: hypothetical protein HKL96_04685, partial [Phycisphaerales bacterium]|nr:hypothetical protein [Phycisphaerales bacterium]
MLKLPLVILLALLSLGLPDCVGHTASHQAPAAAATLPAQTLTSLAPPNAVGAQPADLIGGKSIILTTGAANEATSIFSLQPVNIAAFQAQFTYQMSPIGHGKPADGMAFVLQRDPRGTKALGQGGGFLGYGGGNAIEHSAALEINVFAANTVGFALHSGGRVGSYVSTDAVNLASGHPIRVKLYYDGVDLHIDLRDQITGQHFAVKRPWAPLAHIGKERAFVGFTGGSGGLVARQQITGFSYQPLPSTTLANEAPASLVNVFTGTLKGGNMFPGASAPFGMVQLSPDTRDGSVGYSWRDRQILGFSMLHMSSVGDRDGGDVFFTATTGPINVAPAAYHSPFSHWHESGNPGYYQVRLLKPDINVQLTASLHAGVARLTFPAGRQANLLVPISHTLTSTRQAQIEIIGHHESAGMVKSQAFAFVHQFYSVYFVMQFSKPFTTCGSWTGQDATARLRRAVQANAHQPPIGAYVSWPAGPARHITVKIGISFVDLAGAKRNLVAEVGGRRFGQVRRQTQQQWNNVLSRIAVAGGSIRDRILFYTALYHAALMPSVFSDVDGRYIGFDQRIHQLRHHRVQYANYSGWDIYRTESPLLCILFPGHMAQMCQSLVRDYRQGGWMPRWPQYNFYTNIMCGSPLTTFICTAYRYGIHDFDVQTAYQGMLKDATTSPPPGKPFAGELAIKYINKLHYIPLDKMNYGPVS